MLVLSCHTQSSSQLGVEIFLVHLCNLQFVKFQWSYRGESTCALSRAGWNSRSSECADRSVPLPQNLFHTSRGVQSKGLVGEDVQLHREEKVFLVPDTGAEIRQFLGKTSRGMIFV